MSLALYGTENYHSYMHIKTTFEIIMNPHAHNNATVDFVLSGFPILTPITASLLVTHWCLSPDKRRYPYVHVVRCMRSQYSHTVIKCLLTPCSVHINQALTASTSKHGCVTVMFCADLEFLRLGSQSRDVYNEHSLVHLADDASRFGPLDNISYFTCCNGKAGF